MQEIKGRTLRVMVADDSAVMRGIMRTLFATHAEDMESELPRMEICGEASDGVECLEMVGRTQPDVLLLDLEMPRMHGLGVLDRLRAESPELPVIMCSAYTELGARLTVDALARGASDYVMKPSVQSDFTRALRVLSEQLLPKIAALAMNPKTRCDAGRVEERGMTRPWLISGSLNPRTEIVVIGISTGGPSALEVMLSKLPADFPVPMLIVQHMPKLFTGALAERLDRCCALQVKEAYDGAVPVAGTVWIAQGDMHMEVRTAPRPLFSMPNKDEARICLHESQPVNYCRPSVDLLFQSAADIYRHGTLALLMTGMGSDGVAGARSVHEFGGRIWAQDKASSAVWGMPGRLMQTGLVDSLVPLTLLGEELTRQAWEGRRKREGSSTRQGFANGRMMRGLEAADGLF
jgi:two-component system, chemotaxis family, protein-glutamate methylesterase/glutaminase